MSNQMQRLMSRVDRVQDPIGPVVLLGPATTKPSTSRRAREAHRRAIRMTRERAGVFSGRVPRAVEAGVASEISDVHDELVAAGLL